MATTTEKVYPNAWAPTLSAVCGHNWVPVDWHDWSPRLLLVERCPCGAYKITYGG